MVDEFQVHDWVYKVSPSGIVVPVQLTLEELRNQWFDPIEQGAYHWAHIPITEEMLEKNGAIAQHVSTVSQRTSTYIIETNRDVLYDAVFIEKWGNGDFGLIIETKLNMDGECDEHFELPDVKYVDELQRALRVCKLKTLANNWKV